MWTVIWSLLDRHHYIARLWIMDYMLSRYDYYYVRQRKWDSSTMSRVTRHAAS